MKTIFTYNFVNKTIVGSRRSIERANKGLAPEYTELTQKLAEHPDFTVTEKVINQKANKKTYKKLTFEKMEEYISYLSNSKERLEEFEAVKKIADARGAKYPLTKKWFLEKYPEYKENEITTDQTENLITETAEENNKTAA